ncbi:ABC transporter permease [Flavobacterium cerinum]|uniref:ABC transporter permease n=1 Tax=Flavobacterium cerinum TaxID=2502784 RepID=A0A3S3RFS9_9FLAO|nr:hypothetical protein [Flavobacterium cerinum]RWW96724.1 hypothetical protein EPI11_14110 [Flavobacterium cerinum]
MWKFIKYEVLYWIKRPMVWIFLFITTLLSVFLFGSQDVNFGGAVPGLHKNAPFLIEGFYAIFSVFFLVMVTAFMNATAIRDFQYNTYQLIFSSPIKKQDYFFGKFFGASIISVIPMLGISLGAFLAPVLAPLLPDGFNMAPPERFGEVVWSGHINGIIMFGVPNVIIAGVLLYTLALLFRSNIVSFISVIFLIVIANMANGMATDIKKEWIASIIDPFGRNPFGRMTQYFTIADQNTTSIGLEGDLLINRIVWLVVSLAVLWLVYYFFSFHLKKERTEKRKEKHTLPVPAIATETFYPKITAGFSFKIFYSLVRFEIRSIVANPVFKIVVAIGLIKLITSLSSFTGSYGTSQYPVTYTVIDVIDTSFNTFMLGFVIFYTGVLVWKERDAKLNEIEDATPVKTGVVFASKALAVIFSMAIVFVFTILIGMLAQTFHGYTNYEIGLYVKSLLVLRLLHFSYLVILSLLLHYTINNRYIGYVAFIVFILFNGYIWSLFKIDSLMVSFGNTPSIVYSDMNGFGPFVPGTVWFTIY